MRYVNGFIQIFLLSAGIIPRGSIILKILLRLVLLALHFVLIIGESVAFFSPIKSIYRIEILYQTLCFVYIGSTEFISWYNKNVLIKICSKICEENGDLIDLEIWYKMEEKFKKIMKIFVAVYLFSITVYISAPLTNFVLRRNFSDPLSYPLPYWFCNFEVHSLTQYMCMNVTQNFLCIAIFFIYACSFAFVVCATLNCWIHVEELKSRIEMLGCCGHGNIHQLQESGERYLEAELRMIIQHQQRLKW